MMHNSLRQRTPFQYEKLSPPLLEEKQNASASEERSTFSARKSSLIGLGYNPNQWSEQASTSSASDVSTQREGERRLQKEKVLSGDVENIGKEKRNSDGQWLSISQDNGEPDQYEKANEESKGKINGWLDKLKGISQVSDLYHKIVTCKSQDRYEELSRQFVDLSERVYGKAHESTIDSYGTLAHCLEVGRKFSEAELWRKKVLLTRKQVFGAYHGRVVSAYIDLALCCRMQGKHEEDKGYYKSAVETSKKTLEGGGISQVAFQRYQGYQR